MQIKGHKIFFIGISLGQTSNYDSGVAVLNNNSDIILLDKLYSSEDFSAFFKNFNSLQDSVIAVSLPGDNSLLEGKWRIQTKNYQMVSSGFEIDANQWTNRISKRECDTFLDLKMEGCEIFRYFNFQLRNSYGFSPYFQERSSLDCKSLQTALKVKYDFDLPDNMLPASNLEAILGAVFARDIYLGSDNGGVTTKTIAEFCELEVLQKI